MFSYRKEEILKILQALGRTELNTEECRRFIQETLVQLIRHFSIFKKARFYTFKKWPSRNTVIQQNATQNSFTKKRSF